MRCTVWSYFGFFPKGESYDSGPNNLAERLGRTRFAVNPIASPSRIKSLPGTHEWSSCSSIVAELFFNALLGAHQRSNNDLCESGRTPVIAPYDFFPVERAPVLWGCAPCTSHACNISVVHPIIEDTR
jgi:hypothetical protein